MPNDGFEIQITESEFRKKEPGEQNWILFQGVTHIGQCVNDLDKNGCSFARNKHRTSMIKIVSAIASAVTVSAGFIYMLFHIFHHA